MKKQTPYVVAVLITIASAGAMAAPDTLSEAQTIAIQHSLSIVKAPELAGSAVTLVKAAAKADREATAVAVVKTVIATRPTAVGPVISAIVRAFPATAPAISAAAVKLLPDQATLIAHAATLAAPEMALKIMSAMSQQEPQVAAQVEQGVASAVPSQAARISAVRLSDSHADTITTFQTPIGSTPGNPEVFPVTPPAPQIFVTTIPPNTPRTYASP